jgi:glycosyltransferase involved in cell wall biosynthesis
MSFVLPTEYSAASAPAPTDEQVRLEQIPLQTLAVVDFTGFATDGEIARQREKLLSQLKADGVQLIVDSTTDAFSVFQYDPPYTLPWLRRNELAIPVVAPRMSPLGADAVEDGESEPPVSGEVVEDDETLEGDRAIAGAADDESDTENEL